MFSVERPAREAPSNSIAPVERTVTCAVITSPATAADGFVMPRLDEPVDVAAVQLVVLPAPGGSTHVAISAGSIRYGSGSVLSSRRRPSVQPEPLRVSDQRSPAGVTSGAREAHAAVRAEMRCAVCRVELPAPRARP